MNPFEMWAPTFHAPWSGDVIQEIAPRLFSDDIAGVPEIEERVTREVASYGAQLGKILDALQVLAKAQDTELPEIDTLVLKVDAIKSDCRAALHADAERALARLERADPDSHAALLRKTAR